MLGDPAARPISHPGAHHRTVLTTPVATRTRAGSRVTEGEPAGATLTLAVPLASLNPGAQHTAGDDDPAAARAGRSSRHPTRPWPCTPARVHHASLTRGDVGVHRRRERVRGGDLRLTHWRTTARRPALVARPMS
jgi:hypothetical protein